MAQNKVGYRHILQTLCNKCSNSEDFKSWQNSVSDETDLTDDGRLFQTPSETYSQPTIM